MPKSKSIIDELPHVTTRIEATTGAGVISLGTGFFYGFDVEGVGHMPYVITNKHVVHNAVSAKIWLSQAGKNGEPKFGTFNQWDLTGLDGGVVGHPSPEVDIAAFPVGAALNAMASNGTPPFFREFTSAQIPDELATQALLSVEDVYMVGYPTGLWDQHNNLPIVRRGITATPYALDYNDRPEFMIDAACFPGSSGSPVVIANQGSYGGRSGLNVGTRLYLLGLLWGGPQFTAEGEIVVRPVPTALAQVAQSRIPTNLGFCCKARLIRDLEPVISGAAGTPSVVVSSMS